MIPAHNGAALSQSCINGVQRKYFADVRGLILLAATPPGSAHLHSRTPLPTCSGFHDELIEFFRWVTGTTLHLQFDCQIFEISVSNREKQDYG